MKTYKVVITPQSSFGTPIKGDTLFGQLCWAIRNRLSNARLIELLIGYTNGEPFAVISDALPAGYLPRPILPSPFFGKLLDIDRKAAQKRIWLPMDSFSQPVTNWITYCKSSNDMEGGIPWECPQPHNTINRLINTINDPGSTSYTITQLWYGQSQAEKNNTGITKFHLVNLELFIVLDESRLSAEELHLLLTDIGTLGFGCDASIGLGKFVVNDFASFPLPTQKNADAWLTLAPCAPQGLHWKESQCFYQIFTRFGRHGDIGVYLGNPFKAPILLTETGATLTPVKFEKRLFTGQGLGGDGSLTKNDALRGTVHQGYAPVVGISLWMNNSLEVS